MLNFLSMKFREGETMVSDMLNEVLGKEQQTVQKEREAKAEADKIIAKAEAEAKEIILSAKAEAEEAQKTALAKAGEDAKNDIQKASDAAEKLCNELKAGCDSKLDETIKNVKEIVISD